MHLNPPSSLTLHEDEGHDADDDIDAIKSVHTALTIDIESDIDGEND